MAEIPEEVTIGTIKLEPDETFCYTAWGIRYRFKGGEWRILDMAFRKKSDAESWNKDHVLKFEGMEAIVTPVKRCMLLEAKGNVKVWMEELS